MIVLYKNRCNIALIISRINRVGDWENIEDDNLRGGPICNGTDYIGIGHWTGNTPGY